MLFYSSPLSIERDAVCRLNSAECDGEVDIQNGKNNDQNSGNHTSAQSSAYFAGSKEAFADKEETVDNSHRTDNQSADSREDLKVNIQVREAYIGHVR
jgi:hypothetical protein